MSILNLNAPQGRGPVGKKSVKLWMGVGLLAAVLGFGSTFAANITLNSPEGSTEFGQGVTQTVYCGEGESSVNVSPASVYVNPTFKVRFYTNMTGSTDVTPGTTRQTISAKNSQNYPRFSTFTSSAEGWWVLASSPSSTLSPQPTIAVVLANPTNYIFVPKKSDTTYRIGNATEDRVIDAVDNSSSYRLSAVTISNIPDDCQDVNFILSAYSDSSTALTLVTNSSRNPLITEVAAKWTDSENSVNASRSRISFQSTSGLVTASQDDGSGSDSRLTFTFVPGVGGSALSAKDLVKLIVETQEDTLGSSSSS
jgi:hypothetical protein